MYADSQPLTLRSVTVHGIPYNVTDNVWFTVRGAEHFLEDKARRKVFEFNGKNVHAHRRVGADYLFWSQSSPVTGIFTADHDLRFDFVQQQGIKGKVRV